MRDVVFAVFVILAATALAQVGSAVVAAFGVAVLLATPVVWLAYELGRDGS